MLLPNGHYWSEYIRSEGPFWLGIRSSLVAFVGIGPKFTPQFLGTGFVIGTDVGGMLLVLTAKHVVEYAAIKVQGVHNRGRVATPAVLLEPEKPQIGPSQLRAVWMGADAADMPFVRHVAYADNLDVAICVLEVQENLRLNIHRLAPAIALDTRIPDVGEWINIVTLTDLALEGSSPSGDGSGIWSVTTRPIIRIGKVLSQQDEGMGHKARCFTTTVPTSGGMSGGFAYLPRAGQVVAACGIVSTSPAEDEGKTDFRFPGCSTIVGIMGALGLQVPTSTHPTFSTLFELAKAGQVTDVAGPEGLVMEAAGERGACRIYRVSPT